MKTNSFIIAILFIVIILNSCSSPAEPEQNSEREIIGQVVADMVHAVLKPDGTVWTWGNNFLGTLGNGTTVDSDIPVQVRNLEHVVAIDLVFGIGVAADIEGNIWFWGDYSTYLEPPGQDTIVTEPVKISFLKDVQSIHVFALNLHLLRKDGTVWHVNLDNESPTKFIEPVRVPDINNVIEMSEFIVLKNDSSLSNLIYTEPRFGGVIEGIYGIEMVASVYNRRTLILKQDGTVWAWGRNDLGQLGNGSFEDSEVPVRVNKLTDIVAISANYDFNLALKKDGTVWFWGFEKRNENNEPVGLNIPVKIKNLDNVSLIYADKQSIVMTKDGSYWIFDSEERIPSEVLFE